MIKKVIVGINPTKISQGTEPKTLIIINASDAIVYLGTNAMIAADGLPIEAISGTTYGKYVNYYAKGDYYLYAAADGKTVYVEDGGNSIQ